MKVYIAVENLIHEGNWVVAVAATEAVAEAIAERHAARIHDDEPLGPWVEGQAAVGDGSQYSYFVNAYEVEEAAE